jgi:hypothetical protein
VKTREVAMSGQLALVLVEERLVPGGGVGDVAARGAGEGDGDAGAVVGGGDRGGS